MNTGKCLTLIVMFTLSMPLAGTAEELVYDNGEVLGSFSGLEAGQAEAMRLTPVHPATLSLLRLRFSKAGTVEIHVWADNGGNQPDLDTDITPPIMLEAPADEWFDVPLDESVEIPAERHFHVGHVLLQDGGPALRIDTSEAPVSRALLRVYSADLEKYVWSAIGDDAGGQTVYRRYLVRAEIEYHDQVLEKRFTDVGQETGYGSHRRISTVDFDADGDIDVLADGRLLENDGGNFTDISEQVGIAGYQSVRGGVFADYDRDGDLDLFLFVDSCCNEDEAGGVHDHLLRNDGGVFVDVTDEAGTFDWWPNQAASWGDLDGDGYPELFLPGYEQPGSPGTVTGYTLFYNEGDGGFSSVPNPMLLGLEPSMVSRTVPWADYDADGNLDLYVGAYRLMKNYLYRNLGGSFEEVGEDTATAGVETSGAYGHTIGAQWGDIDNDGDLDLVVMNLAHPRFLEFSDLSKIYLNPLGSGSAEFVDVREEVGVEYRETASEPALGDLDNDGDLDLFQTNVYEGCESNLYANRLIEEGSLRFEDISYPAGARVDNGWGAVWADYDGDGDLDLFSRSLFRNDGPVGNWLAVRLEGGEGQDTHGIGTLVTVEAGGQSISRLVSAGKGAGNQKPFELHFGLGQSEMYDSISVRWLGGIVDEHPCGPANRRLTLAQGVILPRPDGGCGEEEPLADGGDGGSAADGGDGGSSPDGSGGCGCSSPGQKAWPWWALLAALPWFVLRPRSKHMT